MRVPPSVFSCRADNKTGERCSPLQILKQKNRILFGFILWSVWLSYENLKRFLKRLTVEKGYDKLICVDGKTVKKIKHKEEKL